MKTERGQRHSGMEGVARRRERSSGGGRVKNPRNQVVRRSGGSFLRMEPWKRNFYDGRGREV